VKVLIGLGFLGCLISMGALLGAYNRYFDLLSHFRVQYIVLISLSICIALMGKRYKSAVVFLICLGIHGYSVARSVSNTDLKQDFEGPQLRLMSSNLLSSNTDYETHMQRIKSVNPDVIVFQEYTYQWQSALSSSLTEYPYKVEEPASHAFGNALYSKYPLRNMRSVAFVDEMRKSVEGTVMVGNISLKVFGTHAPPPMSRNGYDDRNLHLKNISDKVHAYTAPLVIMGDLNISPWSSHFRNFISAANLHDGRRGQGILPTWPTEIPLLQIPIDHILFNAGVRVLSMQVAGESGSDHRIIWADIQLEETTTALIQ